MAETRPHALLLTGPPGVGKTTVLRRAAGMLSDLEISGFLTDEIREGGRREGFRIETFDGRSAVLAHVRIRSPYRISKYGVDLAALDRVVAEQFSRKDPGLVFIDEIGKMECLSGNFVEAVEPLIASARVFVATVALRGTGLIEEIKRRPDVVVWRVSPTNREEMPAGVAEWVRSGLRSRTLRP